MQLALKTYKCIECEATTEAYDRPTKCHSCQGPMTMGETGEKSLPAVGSKEWLASLHTEKTGTRAWMASKMQEIFGKLDAVREEGQKEYAHDEDDAFANFRRAGERLDISKEKILMVFLQKHIDGIYAHLKGHTSQREDVRGRLKDAICYLCLLWGMLDAE